MKVNFVELIVGAIVLIVAGMFFSYAYQANRPSQGFPYTIIAKFDRVDGILVGSDIKLRGIKVGEVTSLDLKGEKMEAVVTFGFSKDLQLPTDSSAEIASESLLGGKYVAIVPGVNEAKLVSGGEIMYTQSAVSLETLISKYIFNTKES